MKRLTDDQVREIPNMLLIHKTLKAVASAYGVHKSAIYKIFRGERYPHLQEELQKQFQHVQKLLKTLPTRKCTKCGTEYPRTSEYFQPLGTRAVGFEARCRLCKKLQNKTRYRRVREEVYRFYSGDPPKCACCGETTSEFLSVDHINGGGKKHRDEIKGTYAGICLWLKRHNFPPGFRILCLNCNGALGFFGYCPHKRQ